jgi:hypothetical protein
MNAIQTAYLTARAQLDIIASEYAASDAIFDAAYEAAGEPEDFKAFYASWAAANPAQAAQAQSLCLAQNAARAVVDAAAEALLDWSLATVLPLAKSDAERADLRTVRSCTRPNVRAKAIDLAMRLAA